ncbi:MAG: ABC transporter permease [Caldilineaceae bacterium]|nr:ABC transporter permease [Caldilineaceae bacterium]
MFKTVLITEMSKLRRSPITWISWLGVSLMPLVSGLFMWVVKEPDRATQLGLLGQKAQFAGAVADWPGYIAMLLQALGIGGTILIAVITAYLFGREYADGTIKNLLALPVARHHFVTAKLVTALFWFGLLIGWLAVEGFVVGWLLALPGFDLRVILPAAGELFLIGLVAWLLTPAVAWVALWGRGYLAPLGFTIFMLMLGMVVGATGWGKWFPWSIAPLFAGVAGPRVETLTPGSLIVLGATFIVCAVGTMLHLRYADNMQ